MDATDDASVLQQLHHDFVEAFLSNDPEAMGAFFTDSAVLLAPRRALVSGKANVVQFWHRAQRMQGLAFESTDVERLGDNILREAGNLQVTMRGEGRDTTTVASKFVAVWIKTGDAWKFDSLIWNGSAEGGGAGRGQAGGRAPGRGGQGGAGRKGYGQQEGAGGGYGQRAGAPRTGRRRGGGPGGGPGGGGGGGYGGGGGGRRRGGPGQGGAGGGGYGQRPGGTGGGRPGRGGPAGGQGGGGQGGGGGGYGGGGHGGDHGGGDHGGGGGGGFGRRAQADDDTPLVPRID